MPLVKVGSKHQVTIPKEIVEKLRLKPGDYVEAELKGKRVILTPKEIKKDDLWFWSPQWQEKERRADQDIIRRVELSASRTSRRLLKI